MRRWVDELVNIDGNCEAIASEINEKLAELNRRSLLKKLGLLAERWSVPLQDIEDRIKAAKKARDRIVHRGHYYQAGEPATKDDLWDYVLVVREVVVRFLLAAIGYRGKYISYVGGYHDADFPPP